jgi:hypothetical protein
VRRARTIASRARLYRPITLDDWSAVENAAIRAVRNGSANLTFWNERLDQCTSRRSRSSRERKLAAATERSCWRANGKTGCAKQFAFKCLKVRRDYEAEIVDMRTVDPEKTVARRLGSRLRKRTRQIDLFGVAKTELLCLRLSLLEQAPLALGLERTVRHAVVGHQLRIGAVAVHHNQAGTAVGAPHRRSVVQIRS